MKECTVFKGTVALGLKNYLCSIQIKCDLMSKSYAFALIEKVYIQDMKIKNKNTVSVIHYKYR